MTPATQAINVGDIVKVRGKTGCFQVNKIGYGLFQLLTAYGDLFTAKRVEFVKHADRPFTSL